MNFTDLPVQDQSLKIKLICFCISAFKDQNKVVAITNNPRWRKRLAPLCRVKTKRCRDRFPIRQKAKYFSCFLSASELSSFILLPKHFSLIISDTLFQGSYHIPKSSFRALHYQRRLTAETTRYASRLSKRYSFSRIWPMRIFVDRFSSTTMAKMAPSSE